MSKILPNPRSSRPSRLSLAALFVLLPAWSLAFAQQSSTVAPAGAPIPPAPVDPAIAVALQHVSPQHVQADIEKLVSFKNRSTISSMETDLPPNTGVTAAADWIFSEYERISADCNNCLEVKRDTFVQSPQTGPASRILKPTTLTNVYAVLRGTDPAQADRRVLVTGHYDSRNSDTLNDHDPAPGANDDASGVAVSIECARVLSHLKFPGTIVFVAVAGEEQGLVGSAHLAKLAKAGGWQLEAVLNNDIVGGDTTPQPNGKPDPFADKSVVRVFSEGVPGPATPQQIRLIQNLGAENDSPSRELARTVEEVDQTYFRVHGIQTKHLQATTGSAPFHPVLIFRRDRFLRSGDHTSFNNEGFPAVRFTEWRENFDHQHQNLRVENGKQYGDLLKYVDFQYVANVARLNAATLADLASAPGVPEDAHILTAALDNNTDLSWTPPAGMPANATFEVVWRPTEAPTWTTFVNAGHATSIHLPVSKDNVIFGIRSVDSAGHRSPAALPTPKR